MILDSDNTITREYLDFIGQKDFPCIAAKAALSKNQVKCFVASDMASAKEDETILSFMYEFVDFYHDSENYYQSAAIIFKQPLLITPEMFDELLWKRLQGISTIDASNYCYDKRVSNDPCSHDFSFSLKEEAFYIIGLHPASSRASRRFKYPAIVFNPHAQFEELRQNSKYEMMKLAVRKRDTKYSGSVNPMLKDFGEMSEVFQYSGFQYDKAWKCPLKINHES